MPRGRHPEGIRRRELTVSRVEKFFESYQVRGQDAIANVQQTEWRFVADGLGAAHALASAAVLTDPEDQRLREVVLGKRLNVKDFVVQSLAIVPASWGSRYPRRDFTRAGTIQLQRYWKSVCRKVRIEGDPLPSEIIDSRKPTDSDYSKVDIRYAGPLFYPVPSQNTNEGIPEGFLHLSASTVIPQSAVFFGSALYHLQSLARKLTNTEEYRTDTRGIRHLKEPTAERRRIQTDIYIALISATLYMGMTVRSRESREELGFTSDRWLTIYEAGHEHWSRFFGLVGASENLKFLRDEKATLESWSRDAVEWWVGDGEEVKGDREVLATALGVLQSELEQILKEMFKLFNLKKQQLAPHIPVNRNSVPPS
ncbi:hypothetical protein JCM3765_003776 [Sporobolomyces pararoseus]